MKFYTSRDLALKKLNGFIDNEIANYGLKRNFDFGPQKRENVSPIYFAYGCCSGIPRLVYGTKWSGREHKCEPIQTCNTSIDCFFDPRISISIVSIEIRKHNIFKNQTNIIPKSFITYFASPNIYSDYSWRIYVRNSFRFIIQYLAINRW